MLLLFNTFSHLIQSFFSFFCISALSPIDKIIIIINAEFNLYTFIHEREYLYLHVVKKSSNKQKKMTFK